MMLREKITIYTDGAARGNPGPAGWGAVIFAGDKKYEIGGRKDKATNNQMELQGAIEALNFVKKNKLEGEVEVFVDSKYVMLGITEWIENWIKNNWRNAAKKPVLNRELWEELYKLHQDLSPAWLYVAGHSGHEWNDRVDEIATSFADDSPVI